MSARWDYSLEVAAVNRIAEEKQPQMTQMTQIRNILICVIRVHLRLTNGNPFAARVVSRMIRPVCSNHLEINYE